MKLKLAAIEARLQALIEGSTARLFSNRRTSEDLAYRLVEAMRAGMHTGPDGARLAPNLYTIVANPQSARSLEADHELLDALQQTLRETSQEAGLRFSGPPAIRVQSDPQLAREVVLVLANNSQETLSDTTDMLIEPGEEAEGGNAIPHDAFLIVDGKDIFQLDQPVVNIGRRPDNQLVVSDPRVSRVHAQLRAARQRYILFDLDSTGGTFVNGERIHQAALFPGDVISLAGLPLVYGQEDSRPGETETIHPGEN